MDLTKLCLRTMLWSLGLTAATGLLLVFLSHSRLLENVLFTLAATTGATLLLWPLSFWLRSHQSRLAGLVGMALVLADYFVLFVLIWGTWLLQQPGFLANFSWETALWETFWFTLLTGFPAVVLLRFWYVPQAYVAARVGTGICLLAFLELMLGAWLERSLQGRGFDLGRLVEAGGLTGLYSLPILACLVGFPRTRPWRWLGVMAAGAGWII